MRSKKRSATFALLIIVVCILSATLLFGRPPFNSIGWRFGSSPVSPTSSLLDQVDEPVPTLPLEYHATTDADEFCPRFSPTYFQDFLDHTASYCKPDSPAELTCFHRFSGFNDKTDSFCYAQGATLDISRKKFHLNCALREFSEQEVNDGLLPFGQLPMYWYDTGPAVIFSVAIDIGASTVPRTADKTEDGPSPSVTPPKTLLLLKREGEGNTWHSLMEIFSTFMTFDILRMPGGTSADQTPLLSATDFNDTQVVILDDRPDGPYFDLWTLFARRKPLRFAELLADRAVVENLASIDLIVPLAGSSNPFWQNDAQAEQCANSQTLNVFSRRVLDFYGVRAPSLRTRDGPMVVTFVWRRGGRRLKNENALLAELGRTRPHIRVQMVDFADRPFSEQVRIAQETDILIGVHGAGLTHAMFMRQGAGAVVEIQPAALDDHHGFRNVAGMRNLGYFRTHAKSIPSEAWSAGEAGSAVDDMVTVRRARDGLKQDTLLEGYEVTAARAIGNIAKRDDWYGNDIEIEEDRFFEVMEAAIKYMYNKGSWSLDVN